MIAPLWPLALFSKWCSLLSKLWMTSVTSNKYSRHRKNILRCLSMPHVITTIVRPLTLISAVMWHWIWYECFLKCDFFPFCGGQGVVWPLNSLLLFFFLLEDPDLVPAVGQLEGAVIASCVKRLIHKWDAVPLQTLYKFLELLTLRLLLGETPVCPGRRDKRGKKWNIVLLGIWVRHWGLFCNITPVT